MRGSNLRTNNRTVTTSVYSRVLMSISHFNPNQVTCLSLIIPLRTLNLYNGVIGYHTSTDLVIVVISPPIYDITSYLCYHLLSMLSPHTYVITSYLCYHLLSMLSSPIYAITSYLFYIFLDTCKRYPPSNC